MTNQKKAVTESYKDSAVTVKKGQAKQVPGASARNAALFGILTALALVLGYVESLVPVLYGNKRDSSYQRGAHTFIRHPVWAAFGHPVWSVGDCPEPYHHGPVQAVQAVRNGGSQHIGRSGP